MQLPLVCLPEDLQLEPGVVSQVNRGAQTSPADVFRCFGCTKPECQSPEGCASNTWRFAPDGYLREILTARVYDVAVQSPLEEARKLSAALGSRILLKREDLQPVFSFKLRGAYNKMAKLPADVRARGVITSSAGNHAQGVALAAARMGCAATICMPVSTPEIKVAAVRALGGSVELVGESYQEAQAAAVAMAAQRGLTFIPPYDDPHVIAGQGTIGDEIARQVGGDGLDSVDAIFVPVGGGGLVAGIAAYVKTLAPHVAIIGVEPSGANAMAHSLARGERMTLSRVDAFADGVAVKLVGAETFRLCRQLMDGVVLVSNAATSAAIKDVFNETRSILEPAGALAVAGAKAWLRRHAPGGGKTVIAVTSGANINFERLRLVSELADVGAVTEATLATVIPERPGSFRAFIEVTMGGGAALPVTEFKYRYAGAGDSEAAVLWGVGIKSPGQLVELLGRLDEAGMPTTDVSGMEAAQLHLRHLVGGRAAGPVSNERLYQVIFPEKAGALAQFLAAISPRWNVTLFHYRNTGNRESSALVGVQVPPEEAGPAGAVVGAGGDEFDAALAHLTTPPAAGGEAPFTIKRLPPDVRAVFDRFIQ